MPLGELTREFAEAVARQHPALQSLSLARNALTHVSFLELLPPLRRLDLSANALRALPAETAQWGATLTFLDLSDNTLESLQQLRFCRALVTLRASRNRIALFSELKFLHDLDALQELTLDGNPIARQPFYRREVVAMLPQLQQLDGRAVTPAERLVASLQQKPLLTTAASTDLPSVSRVEDPPVEAVSPGDEALAGPRTLDLSGASNGGGWSLPMAPLADSAAVSPSSSASPSAASSSSSVVLPSRRPLLTPASLRRTVEVATQARPMATDVSVQAASSVSDQPEAGPNPTTQLVVTRSHEAPREPVALLQSRVSAMESILALQDKMLTDELTQMGKEQPHAVRDPERAARVYTQLLATWRHKVVALMVQIKSLELQQPPPGRDDPGKVSIAAVEQARQELGRQLDIWKQKCADAIAQRDLERVRAEQMQRQCEGVEGKVVRVVRTLATERERVRSIAEEVALFAAKEGAMTTHMDALAHETHRLMAFETRLRLLSERLQLASRLVAHREARLRNSEAAIAAERRVWQHKTADMDLGDSRVRTGQQRKSPLLLLRPATEQALRMMFHRLDPYHTGLVDTKRLLNGVRQDLALQDALGGGDIGNEKRKRLSDHIEKEVRERSRFGGVGGTLTWGEVLLIFMPVVEKLESKTTDQDRDERLLLSVDELGVPQSFDEDIQSVDKDLKKTRSHRLQAKSDKQALQTLSQVELIGLVCSLRGDRDQLQQRIIEDARQLQRRVQSVEKKWERKVDELVRSNDDLHHQIKRQTERADESYKKLQDAERAAGEAQYQLQNLRRQLSEQASSFAKHKSDLEAQCVESVEREQQVWQRELQDMAFQQTQLQAENAKLELTARQLERELARQRDQQEKSESMKVQHLEDKVRKRDDEIAKLRRERNTILSALRDQERKLSLHTAERAAGDTSSAATQTIAPPPPICHSIGVQVAPRDSTPVRTDHRMRLDEIAPPPPPPFTVPPVPSATPHVRAIDLHTRLQHLESLTQSLLADD